MRFINDKYRKWLAQLPCVICGDNTATEACHIRYAVASIGKASGIGQKPHDYYCTPMCGKHHREQHAGNERAFWTTNGIDPIPVALLLFCIDTSTADFTEASKVVEAARGNKWLGGI